jgi:hypothetical protein
MNPLEQQEWFAIVKRNREMLRADVIASRAQLDKEIGERSEHLLASGETDTYQDGTVRWISDGVVVLPEAHTVVETISYDAFLAQLIVPERNELACFRFWPEGVMLPERALEILGMMGYEPNLYLEGPLYWSLDLSTSTMKPPGTLQLAYHEQTLLEGNWADGKLDFVESDCICSDFAATVNHYSVEPLLTLFYSMWPWKKKSRRRQTAKPHSVGRGGD